MSLLFLFGIVLIGILIIAFLVSITLAFQLYETSSEPRYLLFCTTGLFSLAAGGTSLKFNWQDWKSGTLVVNEIDWADVALGLVIVGGIVVCMVCYRLQAKEKQQFDALSAIVDETKKGDALVAFGLRDKDLIKSVLGR